MTAENFIYWLNGYFEISNSDKLSKEQVQILKDHLKLCFDKITPLRISGVSNPSFDTIRWNIPVDGSISTNPPASC